MHPDPGVLLALGIVGAVAGCLGSVVGIGGGVLLVPTLVALFGFDMRIAVATSLVAVVATSTAAGSVYVGSGMTNTRLAMSLEVATTLGGLGGGLLATLVPARALAGLFAAMTALTMGLMLRKQAREPEPIPTTGDPPATGGWEEPGRLAGGYYDAYSGVTVRYEARRLGLGSAVALVAGAMSGMLGVGGGFLKVPAMTLGMRVPLRVAAATSNFMIGVTAVSSLYVYFARGYVYPLLVAPVAVGVIGGSFVGTRLAGAISPVWLRWILAALLGFVTLQMSLRALGIGLEGIA